ncbi:MAG: hypothetical protein HUK20_00890 [Fibrobacter sp.]|nr:hypothetical protein [Fibrobacter sp.]
MKNIFLIALLTISLACFAQDKKQQTLSEVREAYSSLLQKIKDRKEEPRVSDYAKFTVSENWPGSGLREKTVEAWYSMDFDEEGDMGLKGHEVNFIRVKYNWAAVNYLEEYVISNQKVIFVFYKEYADSKSDETRIYNKNGITILDKKKKDGATGEHPVNMQVIKADEDVGRLIQEGERRLLQIKNFLMNN